MRLAKRSLVSPCQHPPSSFYSILCNHVKLPLQVSRIGLTYLINYVSRVEIPEPVCRTRDRKNSRMKKDGRQEKPVGFQGSTFQGLIGKFMLPYVKRIRACGLLRSFFPILFRRTWQFFLSLASSPALSFILQCQSVCPATHPFVHLSSTSILVSDWLGHGLVCWSCFSHGHCPIPCASLPHYMPLSHPHPILFL